MAIFEKTIQNKKFDQLLWKLENEIPASSWSAELEAGSDFKEGDARCSVRVFERYSIVCDCPAKSISQTQPNSCITQKAHIF